MLGTKDDPRLLVSVADDYDPSCFKFFVVNGAWNGVFTNGHVTVLGSPCGDWTDLDITEILCDNQDRLRCEAGWSQAYNAVFDNFHNPDYIAPISKKLPTRFDDMDDDIPF